MEEASGSPQILEVEGEMKWVVKKNQEKKKRE